MKDWSPFEWLLFFMFAGLAASMVAEQIRGEVGGDGCAVRVVSARVDGGCP